MKTRRTTVSMRRAPLLTLDAWFDSYLTMYTERGTSGRLAPGQFERIAKALADPRRFAMLETIGETTECANQALCRDFPVSKATISHHVKELVQAGLVEPERVGQYVTYNVRSDIIKAYAAELVRRATGTTTARR